MGRAEVSPLDMAIEFKEVLVIGAGTMGSGIAMWMAQNGVEAHLYDISPELVDQSIERILEKWRGLASKGKFSREQFSKFESLLKPCKDYSTTAPDLIIEAIVEKPEIKSELFRKLDREFSPTTIIASNTSSLSINELAQSLGEERQKRFLGLHFFNPAPIMKLVEIVAGSSTDSIVVAETRAWFTKMGKAPAVCQDEPGFIVNRLARNYYGEALRLATVDDTDSFEKIDHIMEQVGGFKMGPFKLMDLIGIDINYSVTESVWKSFFYNSRFKPHALQRKMVQSGRLGKKVGKGFYEY